MANQPKIFHCVEQRRGESAPSQPHAKFRKCARVPSRREQDAQREDQRVGGHEEIVQAETEGGEETGARIPRIEDGLRRGGSPREFVGDNSVRRGGSPQGGIQNPENGEQDQG